MSEENQLGTKIQQIRENHEMTVEQLAEKKPVQQEGYRKY